jgi:hypothetical protein
MDAPTPAGLSTARQVSLVHVHGLYHRSVSNHPMPSRRRFNTLPFSATGFHASARVWTSPFTRRLVKTSGRIEFVILRTDSSSPVASHPASRRRSYIRLQAGERMPEEDSHLSDHVRFRAHECGGSAPLWFVAERRRWSLSAKVRFTAYGERHKQRHVACRPHHRSATCESGAKPPHLPTAGRLQITTTANGVQPFRTRTEMNSSASFEVRACYGIQRCL